MHTRDRVLGGVAALCLLASLLTIVLREPASKLSQVSVGSAPPRGTPGPFTTGIAVTLKSTAVHADPDQSAPRITPLRAGVALPAAESRNGWLRVTTPCERSGWIPARDVTGQAPNPAGRRRLGDYTFVLDPGHSVSAAGAKGPAGLKEAEVNFDIVQRVVARLAKSPHPPRVLVTRGPDHDAGLGYRTALANELGADALISVHNNAGPDRTSDMPGTETYYQVASPASKRLAGLAYEEIVKALARFNPVVWAAENDAGAKYRIATSGSGDYYGILRRSTRTAVLVESAFISNAPEEAILRTPKGRDAIARALTRAIVRWATTDDPGSGFVTPYPRHGGPSGRLPSDCREPV